MCYCNNIAAFVNQFLPQSIAVVFVMHSIATRATKFEPSFPFIAFVLKRPSPPGLKISSSPIVRRLENKMAD